MPNNYFFYFEEITDLDQSKLKLFAGDRKKVITDSTFLHCRFISEPPGRVISLLCAQQAKKYARNADA